MKEVISRFGSLFAASAASPVGTVPPCNTSPERDDTALRGRLRHWATLKPRWGAPILHDVLKAEDLVINHKRTERIYRDEGLSLRR